MLRRDYTGSFVGFRYSDSTGKVGKVEVIEDNDFVCSLGKRIVTVKCDCGKILHRCLKNIVSGDMLSCGKGVCVGKYDYNLCYKGFRHEKSNLRVLNDSGYLDGNRARSVSCICSCGTKVSRRLKTILNGSAVSCSTCSAKLRGEILVVGYRHEGSQLVVTKTDGIESENGSRIVECTCDCGKVVKKRSSTILGGLVKCGKSCPLILKRDSLIGTHQKMGRLRVDSYNDDGTLNCICDCGGLTNSLKISPFMSESTRSCGCLPTGFNFRFRLFNNIHLTNCLGKTVDKSYCFKGTCTKCNVVGIFTQDMIMRHKCGSPDLFDREFEKVSTLPRIDYVAKKYKG